MTQKTTEQISTKLRWRKGPDPEWTPINFWCGSEGREFVITLFNITAESLFFFWEHAANVDIWEACVRKMSSIFDWNLPHDHVKSSVDGLVVCLPETKGSWKRTCCMRFQWNSSPSVYLSRCYRQQVTCFSIVFDILQTEWWLISQSNDLSVCDYVRGSLKH